MGGFLLRNQMDLKGLLIDRKKAILSKWFQVLLDTYPPETAKFFKNQDDIFRNPVGSTIFRGIENLFDEIIDDNIDTHRVSQFLDEIIKIRAIQDFSASQAVAFIFSIKDVIRREISDAGWFDKPMTINFISDLHSLESKIDGIALLSFDVYMQSRERLYEIKANEVKRMTYRLLQQAKLIVESPDKEIC